MDNPSCAKSEAHVTKDPLLPALALVNDLRAPPASRPDAS